MSVINFTTGEVTATIQTGGSPAEVAVSPDGRRLYVANYDAACVSVIDTE